MKRSEREAQWAKHIEGWKRSGLTQARYCERECISYDTFKRWRRRRRVRGAAEMRGSALRFVPVRVASAPAAQPMPTDPRLSRGLSARSAGAEVRLSNGRAIALGRVLDEIELGRLIRLLEVLPC